LIGHLRAVSVLVAGQSADPRGTPTSPVLTLIALLLRSNC